ncbi:DUF4190 domain-containing protein [Bacillus thermotolerans]|uniref:DUF4190 domain-containing protein n=1 Tax=Bacillus thermotolerans TaxID=1221996 RepID=UPI0005805AAD|nr:DUF4190 domain-containing protein [Bacillus thermotolerans]KKB33239.1 hypothetical protein QY97_03608 [Bacillus thermotolerans]
MPDDKPNQPEEREAGYTREQYIEETAAELADPLSLNEGELRDSRREGEEGSRGLGYTALIISIVSLFILPILLGAVGIGVGFLARRRGAEGLGSWAIGIGIASIVMGLFVLPFF